MKLGTFKGGIHPFEGKDLSKDLPVKAVLPKGNLVFPLSQHIGAPAKPVVAVGDRVLAGQLIAEAGGFISANVVSSVSGTVKAIEERLIANGSKSTCIIVENDGAYETVEGYGTKRDYQKLGSKEIIEAVKAAGIVGMGGAGFPTHVKLAPKDPSKIEYVLANGAECEPYLTSDYRLMLENGKELIGGMKVILKLFPNAKGMIVVEDNKPDAIAALKEMTANEPDISVCPVKTKYPQGGERTLIFAATGRKIWSGMLPADVGCIVNNVGTIIAVYRAVCESTPLLERVVTITGDAVKTPRNFSAKIGMSFAELVEEADGFTAEPEKIIYGGPMMGPSMYTTEVPVTKICSSLLALKADPVAKAEDSPCIRCGRCASVCPGRVIPQKLMECVESENWEEFERLNGMECCECGCCSYICPAKRPLTQALKLGRKTVMDNRRKAN